MSDPKSIRECKGMWSSEAERLEWEYVAETHPRKPGENQIDYIVRLSEIATGQRPKDPAKPMPTGWLPYKEPEE